MPDGRDGPVARGEGRRGGSLSPKAWVAIVAIICATAVGITALILYAGGTSKTPTNETTTTIGPTTTVPRTVPTTTTTASPPATTTTTTTTTTTLPPPTTAATTATITYGSPTGQVVWQSGESVTASATASMAYYCCYPPSPTGENRSGSAGCSGNAGVGGFYLDGRLC